MFSHKRRVDRDPNTVARNRLDHFDHFAQGMACAGTDIDRPTHGTKLGKPAIGIGNGADIAEIPENIQVAQFDPCRTALEVRSEEHTSELQSLMRISYAVFCLKKKKYITLQEHI